MSELKHNESSSVLHKEKPKCLGCATFLFVFLPCWINVLITCINRVPDSWKSCRCRQQIFNSAGYFLHVLTKKKCCSECPLEYYLKISSTKVSLESFLVNFSFILETVKTGMSLHFCSCFVSTKFKSALS